MTKKTEEAPIARRASYIDANTGQQTPPDTPTTELPEVGSAELQQIVAETRATMTADLQAKLDEAEAIIRQKREIIDNMSVELAELHEAITELKRTPRGVDSEVYEYTNDETGESYVVVQVDTEEGSGRIKVYVNDGMVYDGDPEQPESKADEADARAMSFFTQVEKHLSTYDAGAQAVLAEVQRRTPIERAGYIKSLERVADVMQESTDRLRDMHHRSQIADQLSTGL
jgi:hypothetical protein